MKKISNLFLSLTLVICTLMIPVQNVNAAGSFSVSRSASSLGAGKTATVTISVSNCSGQFSVSATNGATVSESSIFVDSGSYSVTVKAPASGSFTVSVTAVDVISWDATPQVVSGTKSLSFTVSSSSSSNSSGTTSTDTRDKDSSLDTLTVSNGKLSPEFSKTNMSYTVNVLDISTITINAKANSSKAKVTGTGEKNLELGENIFNVVVTAENETKTTYKLSVVLDKTPEIYTEYNDQELGLVQNQDSANIPDNFEETTVELNGIEVPAYYNSVLNLTVLYMSDFEGTKNLYVYSEGSITSLFRPLAILGRSLVVLDILDEEQDIEGYVFGTVVIDDHTFFGWTPIEENLNGYTVFKALDEEGVYTTFLYDSVTNTMIRKPDVLFVSEDTLDNLTINDGLTDILIYAIAILGAITVISVISAIKSSKNIKR